MRRHKMPKKENKKGKERGKGKRRKKKGEMVSCVQLKSNCPKYQLNSQQAPQLWHIQETSFNLSDTAGIKIAFINPSPSALV